MLPAQAVLPRNPPQVPGVIPSNRNQIIRQIALQTLAELAISLTIGAIVCSCAPASFSLVFTAAAIQCLINLVIRMIGAIAAQKILENGPHAKKYMRIAQICSFYAPYNFAVGTAINGQAYVHETGHALAAQMVYKGANPKIEMFPFIGAATHFNVNQLSRFGEKLGANRSLALVAAAGPLLSLSVSSTLLTTSLLIKDKHPTLSRYLLLTSLIDFSTHASYAFSALFTSSKNVSHDFVRLSGFGIHPLAATVAIAVSPIVIALGVTAIQRRGQLVVDARPIVPNFA